MTFNFEQICLPAGQWEQEGEGAATLGAPGALCVALVSSGAYGVLQQPSLHLSPGHLLLAQGTITLLPTGHSHVVAAALKGAAAQQLYAQLALPAVINAAGCPGAPEALYLLAGAEAPALPAARASALAYSLLCELAGASPAAAAPLPPLVVAALADIHERFAEVYGIEELAAKLGVNKSHLVRSFTAAMQLSPGRYLTAVRLEAAKRLLLHREYPLDMVANLCGFSGANYLCKVFKKATGQSPAAWRAKNVPAAALPAAEWEGRIFL